MTIKDISKVLESYDKIGITCHVSPDGDAMGSSLALYEVLRKLGKHPYIISKESIEETFKFLPNADKVNEDNSEVEENTDCVVVLDCGNVERINGNIDVNSNEYDVINIDHHKSNDMYGKFNYVDDTSASVGQIIYEIMEEMGVELDENIAKCIYTSILTDTGSFRHSGTSKKTHEIAGMLINTGIDFSEIHRTIFDNKKFERIKLYGKVIDTIKLDCNDRLCTMYIKESFLKELGLENEDTSDLLSFGTKIGSVEVTALIKEFKGGVKVSLRSKNIVDVSAVAENFGGGGHIRAAGFAVENASVEEVKEKLIEIVGKELI